MDVFETLPSPSEYEEAQRRNRALGESTAVEVVARGGEPVRLATVAGIVRRGPATSHLLLTVDTDEGRMLVEVPITSFHAVPESPMAGADRCPRCARPLATPDEHCKCPVPGW